MLLEALPTLPAIELTLSDRPSPIESVTFLGEYLDTRVETDTPHLSPSHLRDRQYCAAQNWFVRRHGMAKHRSATMIRGTGIHYGLNKAMHANKTTIEDGRQHPITFEQFLYIAQRHGYRKTRRELDEAVRDRSIEWDRRWQKGPELSAQSVIYDVHRAIAAVAPYFYEHVYPLAIEAAFLIHWKRAGIYPLLGVADVIDLREDYSIGVRDLKSSIKRKGLVEVAFDRALIAYAGAITDFYGIQTAAIGYENITFTSPGRSTAKAPVIQKPAITHYTLDIEYEPATLETLEIECADAMLDIRDNRVSPRRSPQTCVRCPFTTECSEQFGPLHSSLLAPPDNEGDDSDV